MALRTPLGQALGLGSAKEGVSHWWWQRLTSVALIPLSIWFVFSLASMSGAEYQAVLAWVRSPVVTALLIMFVVSTLYHAQLGLQVVIEDYVHTEWLKMTCLLVLYFITVFFSVVTVVLILSMAMGN